MKQKGHDVTNKWEFICRQNVNKFFQCHFVDLEMGEIRELFTRAGETIPDPLKFDVSYDYGFLVKDPLVSIDYVILHMKVNNYCSFKGV